MECVETVARPAAVNDRRFIDQHSSLQLTDVRVVDGVVGGVGGHGDLTPSKRWGSQ